MKQIFLTVTLLLGVTVQAQDKGKGVNGMPRPIMNELRDAPNPALATDVFNKVWIRLTPKHAFEFARKATSMVEAECVVQVAEKKYIRNPEAIIQLCEGAKDLAAIACLGKSPVADPYRNSIRDFDVATLCRHAPRKDPSAPIKCYKETDSGMSTRNKMYLCSEVSAINHLAPIECYRDAGTRSSDFTYDQDNRVELCHQAPSRFPLTPVGCYQESKDLKWVFFERGERVNLCKMAESFNPVSCTVGAREFLMTNKAMITLCNRAPSAHAPVECLGKQNIQKGYLKSEMDAVEACRI